MRLKIPGLFFTVSHDIINKEGETDAAAGKT